METACQAHQPSSHLPTYGTVTSLLFRLCGVHCPSPGGKHRSTTTYLTYFTLFPTVIFQPLPTKGQRCILAGSNTTANSRHWFSAFSDSHIPGVFMQKYLYKYQLQLNLSHPRTQPPFQVHIPSLHVFFCICLKDTPCHMDKSRLVLTK